MGAYELPRPANLNWPMDLYDDGMIGIKDLLALLAAWGLWPTATPTSIATAS